MQPPMKNCFECGKPIKGRQDKKFCDDYCRNAYNNKQNSEQSGYMRKVNSLLRKNRKILEALVPEGEGMSKQPRQRLLEEGFEFKYHTHQYANKKGNVYYFCYEYGYLPIEGDWVLIVKRKEDQDPRHA